MKFKKRTRPADFGGASVDFRASEADADDDMDLFIEPPPGANGEAAPALSQATSGELTASGRQSPARISAEPAAAITATAMPSAWPLYLAALAIAVLWALAPIAFAVGYRNNVQPLRNDAFAMAVFALMAVGPAVFVLCAAYMIRQGQKLSAESRRAQGLAEDLLSPALSAAARAGDVVRQVREEIQQAAIAADEARDALVALRELMASETESLSESARNSTRVTQELSGVLGRERSEMGALALALDAQAAKVADSIAMHAKMVAEASDLAEIQLHEAEAALSARTADLAAAASEVSDTTRTAGEDLTRHIARLETAGVGVADQIRAVQGGLGEQRTALVALAQTLRSDQTAFAEATDAHALKLSQFIEQARASAGEVNEQAAAGSETLRKMMSDAAAHFRDLAETARTERDEFGQATLHSMQTVAGAAGEQRAQMEAQTRAAIAALTRAAEETRAAAATHAAAAREQVDQLSEAAFSAGQKANQVFEARLAEARALVETSSEMVEKAGAASAQKLEAGAAAARASLAELEGMLAQIEQRTARLPESARGQVDLVQAAVAKGMEDLMVQARHTAEQAYAIDAAFQDRVRRNFEMLGEAVQLMGAAATPAPAIRPPPPLEAPVSVAPRTGAAVKGKSAEASPPGRLSENVRAPESELDLDDLMEPAKPSRSRPPVDPGLRPRLKLTPTASDEEFSAVFEAAGGVHSDSTEPAAEPETWTWKDLLASIDGAEADGERLQDILALEVHRMGVEPAKLLPKGRIDEIAAAVQTGDLEGGREVVRRLAPAAIRRIARRLVTDEGVRRQAQVYVRRYQTLVDDAAVRDPEGFLMASLLGDDAGRLFLLLDASAGDPG